MKESVLNCPWTQPEKATEHRTNKKKNLIPENTTIRVYWFLLSFVRIASVCPRTGSGIRELFKSGKIQKKALGSCRNKLDLGLIRST